MAAGVGRMVEDEESGRERYEGLSFRDLRQANATGLVAEGVDVKTAQTMLGHSEARLMLDAQAVAKLGEAAAEAMGARFLVLAARDGRAMPSGSDGEPGRPVADCMAADLRFPASPRGESNS